MILGFSVVLVDRRKVDADDYGFSGDYYLECRCSGKTSHLFDRFPPEMNSDNAFFERMPRYPSGWDRSIEK